MVLVACGISLERRPYRAGWRGFRLVPSRLSVFAQWLMRRICHVSSQPIKGRKEEKHQAFPPFSSPSQAPLRASIFLSIFLWEKNSKYRLATNLTWVRPVAVDSYKFWKKSLFRGWYMHDPLITRFSNRELFRGFLTPSWPEFCSFVFSFVEIFHYFL